MITLMLSGGRSRNTPCFCGSGRKLKHCCGRQLSPARTWKLNDACHWQFWQPHQSSGRHASEVAVHTCTGQHIWIARGTDYGTSWLIDDEPVTLLEVIDQLPGALYHWVIEQTMSVLNNAAPPASDSAPAPNDALDEPPGFAEIRILMLEVLRLAHASDALEAHFPIPFTSTQPANLTSQSHTQQPLAS